MATNLILHEDRHRYVLNGEEIPSVSEVTRFLSKDLYANTMQYMMDAAAERGTKVHKATEVLDKYGEAEVTEEILPYLKAYVQFRKDYNPDWEKIEWSVNNGNLYAGTLDRYGTLNGKKVIVDLKQTGTITKQHKVVYTAAQNLYRKAIEPEYQVDAIYILQLKKDGTYKLIELEKEDTLADACLVLHEAMKKKHRKRKET